jgi:hypothetical protein
MEKTWRDTHELAWAAGLCDGEGWIGTYRRGAKRRLQVRLQITQIDRYVLDRFRAAVGTGKVRGPFSDHRPRHSPKFGYEAISCQQVQAVIAMLWRWLSPVKRAQAVKTLALARTLAPSLRNARFRATCTRGHERTAENTREFIYKGYTCRQCRVCEREREATPTYRHYRHRYYVDRKNAAWATRVTRAALTSLPWAAA